MRAEDLLEALGRALQEAPPEPKALAQEGLRALAQALGAEGGWVRLREDGLTLLAAWGVEPPPAARLTRSERERLEAGEVLLYRLPEEATGPASRRWAREGYGGLLLAPLLRREGLAGTLALLFRASPPPEAGEALRPLLPLFTLLLERAQAEAGLRHREELLGALHRLDRAMLEGRPLAEVARVGAEAALGLTRAQAATVSLVEGRVRRILAAAGRAVTPFLGATAPLEEGPHGEALRGGRPVLLRRIPSREVPSWLLALRPLGNALVLPLTAGGRTVGFLSLYGLENPEAALSPAQAFAAQLALALLREEDLEALRAQAREQEALLKALEALRAAEGVEGVARTLLELGRDLLGADRGAVLRRLEGGILQVEWGLGALEGLKGFRLPKGQGISWAALEGGTVLVEDVAQDPRVYDPRGEKASGSEIATPLLAPGGEALGVLVLGRGGGAFTPGEARLAEALAQAGATALLRAARERESALLLKAALLAAGETEAEALAQGFALLLAEALPGRLLLFAHPDGGSPCRLLAAHGVEGEELGPTELNPEGEGLARRARRRGAFYLEALPETPLGREEGAWVERLKPQGLLVAPIGRFGVAYLSPFRPPAPEEVTLTERVLGLLALGLERGQALRRERRLRQALERLAAVAPGDLEGLVGALGESLGVRWAFLDRLLTPGRAEAIAVHGGEPFEYLLEGTPCAEVFSGSFCEYREGVTRLFPEDELARAMGAEAYLGVPLRGEGGRVLGILVAMHDRPLPRGEEGFRREVLLAYAQRAALELEAKEREARLEATARAHALLRGAETREELYQRALEAILAHTRASTANLFLHRKEEEVLEVVASRGYLAEKALGQRLRRGQGVSWRVLETGEALYLPDAREDPRAHFLAGEASRAAYLGVPLKGPKGEVLGVLSADTAGRGGILLPEDRFFLTALAEALGAALGRLQVLEELQATREEALKALGLALEYRDLETWGHTERVTRLSLALAEACGLGEPERTWLRLGAYLHDIGKLAIPDAILLKPGPLTEEEWARMKAHTTLGEEMARRLGFLPEATLGVIRHHHERWDGAGYPDGLKGEAIPLLARIFALADVYDALRSERPYKRAFSHEEALAEIGKGMGRQFDPGLARLFLELLGAGPPEGVGYG